MVRAKLEKDRFEAEFTGSTAGVKVEMAFLLKHYKELLEKKAWKRKSGNHLRRNA